MSRTDSVVLSRTPDAAAEADATSETADDWAALTGSALVGDSVPLGCGITIPVAATPAAWAAGSAVTALEAGFALAEFVVAEDTTAAVAVETFGAAAAAVPAWSACVLAWACAGPADTGRCEEPLGAPSTGPAESALSG
jgi:hypothetical protein